MVIESLFLAVYGEAGVGKTPMAHTAPGRRLILDAENGSKFIRKNRIDWNPLTEKVPTEGDWEVCVVQTRDFETFERVMSILLSGKHPFNSVVADSVTEIQKRCRDTIERNSSDGTMTERAWGVLLARMEKHLRELRDLTMHETTPLQCVVLLFLMDEKKGKYRPLVQGGLSMSVPGLVDVLGYQYVDTDEAGNPVPQLLVRPTAQFVAKDRTSGLENGGITGLYGPIVTGPFNLAEMIERIYS